MGGDTTGGKCIFVPFHDGVGNQLFIYAAALVAKKKLGLPLCLLPGRSQHSNKNYRQSIFKNGVAINAINNSTKKRMNNSQTILPNLKNAYNEWANTNIVANTSKNVIMPTTYFQHYAAIEAVVPDMRKSIVASLEKEYPDMKSTIDSATTAFVQVRRGGDYIGLGGAASKEYFQNGIKALCDGISALKKIYFISNDLEWCKQQNFTLKEGVEATFYEEPDELKTLYVMALCKAGAVISGSTFGIWGAVFGPGGEDNSLIIYPKKWIFLNSSAKLKLPERWKAID